MKLTDNPVKSTLKYADGCALWLVARSYSNHRLAIEALDVTNGEPVAILTTNLPDEDLAPDEIAVKDWSENEGALIQLHSAGIIQGQPVRYVRAGFVAVPICQLTQQIQQRLLA